MARKRKTDEKIPQLIEDIAQIIEKGLDGFSPEERSARLDKFHTILAGPRKQQRGTTTLSPSF